MLREVEIRSDVFSCIVSRSCREVEKMTRKLALGSAHDAPQRAHARECEVLLSAAVLKSRKVRSVGKETAITSRGKCNFLTSNGSEIRVSKENAEQYVAREKQKILGWSSGSSVIDCRCWSGFLQCLGNPALFKTDGRHYLQSDYLEREGAIELTATNLTCRRNS